jgi:hypothetical protein
VEVPWNCFGAPDACFFAAGFGAGSSSSSSSSSTTASTLIL